MKKYVFILIFYVYFSENFKVEFSSGRTLKKNRFISKTSFEQKLKSVCLHAVREKAVFEELLSIYFLKNGFFIG